MHWSATETKETFMVRAKFTCTDKVQNNDNGEIEKIRFEAVTCGSKENEQFFKYTPYGKLDMNTINKAAADQFEVGKQYYIDISPADMPVPSL
jgi:hypothetical protein